MGWLPEHYRSEKIRRRAYEIWEEEGRPEGRDFDHWAMAEQQVRSEEYNRPSGLPTMPSERPQGRA